MSTKSNSFQQKIAELQNHVSEASERMSKREKCVPTVLIVGIVAPLLVWVVLYFLQPSFVQNKEGPKYVRSNTKVFYWTVIVTVVIWIALYLFTYCQGYNKTAMFCSRK